MVSVTGSVVSFVVALLVGGLAIYVAARVVADVDDYSHAVVTALVGAVAWALGSLVPLFGVLFALLAWVWVIKWRYPGGWTTAAVIGFAAWVAATLIIYALNVVFDLGVGAFGVPGA
jgi:hypothetical protein